MKKYLLIFLFVCGFLFNNGVSAGTYMESVIPTGTYQLLGSNPSSDTIDYRGQVIIEPSGPNYLLTWKIGRNQVQTGIAILRDHVLSVAYYDHGHRAFGVVSFVVTDYGRLEGEWAAYGASPNGKEWLIFENSSIEK